MALSQWLPVVNPDRRSWLPAEAAFALGDEDALHYLLAEDGDVLRIE